MIPIRTVISGGQTGVDQAALAAARAAGLATGGWMPYGWQTLEGTREDFRALYNMRECQDVGYGARTQLNVRDADATLRIAKTFSSPGERCTLIALHQQQKPHLDISWKPKVALPNPTIIRDWLKQFNVTILNVAGNSERTAPGVFQPTYDFLLAVFLLWSDDVTS